MGVLDGKVAIVTGSGLGRDIAHSNRVQSSRP